MKHLQTAAFCLFAICIPLLLISLNLRFIVSTVSLYETGFEKYNVTEVTGINKSELKKASKELIHYFNTSDDSPQITVTKNGTPVDLFNQREIDHLKDVKGIIQFFYLIQWITLICVIGYLSIGFYKQRSAFLQQMVKGLLYGGSGTLALLAFVGLWALIDFDSLFLRFHLTSFSNDLWILDPSRDHLIMMFPEGFFSDTAILLLGMTVMEALLTAGGAWSYLRWGQKPDIH